MLIGGRKFIGPNIETLIIPRPDGPVAFKAEAIMDFDEFNKLCPEPKPRMMLERGKGPVPNLDDPSYKEAVNQRERRRVDYIVIKSLEATENLQWEKVNLEDPSTWHLYEEELREAGFSDIERKRIIGMTMNVNSLNDEKLEEARKAFLAGELEASQRQSSPAVEPNSTPSGELVNGSVLDRQESKTPGMT